MPRVYTSRPDQERHTKHINIPLTPPQEQKLVAYAQRRGMKKTDAARQALFTGLEAEA